MLLNLKKEMVLLLENCNNADNYTNSTLYSYFLISENMFYLILHMTARNHNSNVYDCLSV